MNRDQKIVRCLPVEELWAGQRLISTIKVRDLNASDIAELLRSIIVRFVVVDVDKPFQWIPNNERYDFWKEEVKPHLVDPQVNTPLDDFPGEYCYFASEWKAYDGDVIVVLSKRH